MHDHTEGALVARLRRRDEHALAELSSLYGQKIFQLAFSYLRNHEDAEEIVQDVLLKVFRKIDMFRGESALSSWIFRITFNAAISRLRRTKASRNAEVTELHVGPAASEDDPGAFDPADWSNMADEGLLRQQMRERLAAAVGDLPAIYRAPVILRDLKGLTTEEASTRLRVKDQTLKSRLHRGRRLLRHRLADFAGGLTMHGGSTDVHRTFYGRSTYVLRTPSFDRRTYAEPSSNVRRTFVEPLTPSSSSRIAPDRALRVRVRRG